MAITTIEWAKYTFNPWRGCTKVAPGCANCYADAMSVRNPKTLGVWGPNGTRVMAAPAAWREPLKWDKAAAAAGERHRVFCASLADVFEDWPNIMRGHKGGYLHHGKAWGSSQRYVESEDIQIGKSRVTMADARRRLFELIDATPNLDWLLLTKRPENIRNLMPVYNWHACETGDCPHWNQSDCAPREERQFRDNVWLGTSISDQATADKNVPELLKCRDLTPVLFLSAEPLLGSVDLSRYFPQTPILDCPPELLPYYNAHLAIDWVIVGGESGPHARPMHPQWACEIRDQCQDDGVPFFFKQNGEWVARHTPEANSVPVLPLMDKGRHGVFTKDGEWREDEGEWSRYDNLLGQVMYRVGKKIAGRRLDGRTWDEFPEVQHASV